MAPHKLTPRPRRHPPKRHSAVPEPSIDLRLREYEGLIFTTSVLLEGLVEGMDRDDIRADLRIKVWRALKAYDPARARQSVDRFVFMCLRNRVKDLGARVRRGNVSLDAEMAGTERRDAGRDVGPGGNKFEGRYLACDDPGYGRSEGPGLVLPNTLTVLERRVLVLVYEDYRHGEVAARLAVTERDVERAMRSLRLKLADWKPGAGSDLVDVDSKAATRVAT